MRRTLWVVWAVLAVAAAGAGNWHLVETSDFLVLSRDPALAISVGERAEEIWTRVSSYWVPLLTPLRTLPEEEELYGAAIPKDFILVYTDPEEYWRHTGRYGSYGIMTVFGYSLIPPGDLLAKLQRSEDPTVQMSLFHGAWVFLPCDEGGCDAALAHELVHLLGLRLGCEWEVPSELGPIVREGMATWTEFALGYRDDFDLRVRQPVACWLKRGGELDRVPWMLRYEVGASLVERLVREVGSPAAALALFCPGVREYLGYPTDAAPAAVLRDIAGLTWEGFLGRWRTELLGLRVTPAGELIHRFYMRNVELRAAFLRPLLAPDVRRELERLGERIMAGEGTEADLARAEAILGDAWAEPTPGILDAIRARMEPLRRLAREISGSEGMLAVYKLSIALATGKCAPEECVHSFAALVNRYLAGTSTCPRAGKW